MVTGTSTAVEPRDRAQGLAPLDVLTRRLVARLDLPGTDPEVLTIVAMLHDALESALVADQPALLGDALRFAELRLRVRGLTQADHHAIGLALVTAEASASRREPLMRVLRRSAGPPDEPGGPRDVAPALGRLTTAYVERLLVGDRLGALTLTRGCLTDGIGAAEILLDILEPAQHDVGRRWALGTISVAQEHFCTAVTQFAMTDLYPGMFSGTESERRLVAAQAPGSLHHVGLRMVVDVLECRGWTTTFLGEDTPVTQLPLALAEAQADLLLVSASMPGQLRHVSAMIRAVRADPRTRGVKVVVGGRPFAVAPDLVTSVGADGWAADALGAVEVCDRLVGAPRAGP